MLEILEPAPPLDNPDFNAWQGGLANEIGGALEFDGVVMRYLPLEADVQALQTFCDNYLNLCPEFTLCKPAMPYVVMCVANYGSMGTASSNLGWESQNEVLFGVPVEWWQVNDAGKLEFRNFAMVAPFIYVDSGASEAGGREVFGWPKCHGWFAQIDDPWASNPRAWRTLLSVRVQAFSQMFANQKVEPRALLDIEEKPPLSLSLFPPNLSDAENTLLDLPRTAMRWMSLLGHSLGMYAPRVLGGEGADAGRALSEFLSSMLHPKKGFVGAFHANTLNLKQMRDAADPNRACYQGYTNAQMHVKRIRQGGLLGEQRLLAGDPSGGLRVRIRRLRDQPIVATLGLKVAEEHTDGGVTIDTLKPVMPFWVEADMRYDDGETLCFRTPHLNWRNKRWQLAGDNRPVRYNTTGSIGFQVPVGPFDFPHATYRVLPLLADPRRMQRVVDHYLNDPLDQPDIQERFEVYGSYAYLSVSRFQEMSANGENVGVWAKAGMNLMVPVMLKRNDVLVSVGLVSPFMFAESDIGVTTAREVNGWPTMMAELWQPPNPWGAEAGPFAQNIQLLELHTDAMRALNAGMEFDWHSVLQIQDGHLIDPTSDAQRADLIQGFGKAVKASVAELAARSSPEDNEDIYLSLAADLMGNGLPINQYSLKQFREVEDFRKACYQAVVRSRLNIERWHELREIEHPMVVRIDHFATLPFIEMLGLKTAFDAADGSYSLLVPQRPFFMDVDLKTRYGEVLYHRVGTNRWTPGEHTDIAQGFFTTDEAVDTGLVAALDENPEHITAISHARRGQPSEQSVDRHRLREIATTLEPQMAVHEVLSRRWGDRTRRDANNRAHPPYRLRADVVGSTPADTLFPEDEIGSVDGVRYWSPQPWPKENHQS